MTVSGFNSQCRTFISLCNQPSRSTQPAIPSWVGVMSTSQRVVTPCGWGVKVDMVRVWVAGKPVWSPCYTWAISGQFRDQIIKRYINSPSSLQIWWLGSASMSDLRLCGELQSIWPPCAFLNVISRLYNYHAKLSLEHHRTWEIVHRYYSNCSKWLLLKVTGSRVHWTSGNISEMLLDNITLTVINIMLTVVR